MKGGFLSLVFKCACVCVSVCVCVCVCVCLTPRQRVKYTLAHISLFSLLFHFLFSLSTHPIFCSFISSKNSFQEISLREAVKRLELQSLSDGQTQSLYLSF